MGWVWLGVALWWLLILGLAFGLLGRKALGLFQELAKLEKLTDQLGKVSASSAEIVKPLSQLNDDPIAHIRARLALKRSKAELKQLRERSLIKRILNR
ncbi:MAG: hypothetical protein ACKOXT_05500 [Actinomycetota bacterium]